MIDFIVGYATVTVFSMFIVGFFWFSEIKFPRELLENIIFFFNGIIYLIGFFFFTALIGQLVRSLF